MTCFPSGRGNRYLHGAREEELQGRLRRRAAPHLSLLLGEQPTCPQSLQGLVSLSGHSLQHHLSVTQSSLRLLELGNNLGKTQTQFILGGSEGSGATFKVQTSSLPCWEAESRHEGEKPQEICGRQSQRSTANAGTTYASSSTGSCLAIRERLRAGTHCESCCYKPHCSVRPSAFKCKG